MVRAELEKLDFISKDYSGITAFTSWSGDSAEDYLDRVYPDAGFLERQYLVLRLGGLRRYCT